jgi:hypothetical protein
MERPYLKQKLTDGAAAVKVCDSLMELVSLAYYSLLTACMCMCSWLGTSVTVLAASLVTASSGVVA